MIVFLDFEASSLAKTSFPIEVAWVFEDGRAASYLIRPAPDWTDQSDEAERIHGISLDLIHSDGAPVETVAGKMIDELSGHDLYASAPSWDGKWLSVLLRAAGLPRHALRLRKSDEAFVKAAREHTGGEFSERQIASLVEGIIARDACPSHRALPDAQLELQRLQMIAKEAAELASRWGN